jgi:hypothetical protein
MLLPLTAARKATSPAAINPPSPLASLRVYKSFTKSIGTNSAGTVTPLKIGATICEIGLEPEGGSSSSGPPSCIIDFSSILTTCNVESAANEWRERV